MSQLLTKIESNANPTSSSKRRALMLWCSQEVHQLSDSFVEDLIRLPSIKVILCLSVVGALIASTLMYFEMLKTPDPQSSPQMGCFLFFLLAIIVLTLVLMGIWYLSMHGILTMNRFIPGYTAIAIPEIEDPLKTFQLPTDQESGTDACEITFGFSLDQWDDYQRAVEALKIRRPELALSLCDQILAQNPGFYFAYQLKASAYMQKGAYGSAQHAVEQALTLDPCDDHTYALLGCIYSHFRCHHQAQEAFAKALKINPENTLALSGLGVSTAEGCQKYKEAEEIHRKTLELEPNDAASHVLLGESLASQNRLVEAEASYLEALRLEPERFEVHNDYGVFLLEKKNNLSQAHKHFTEALRLAPDSKTAQSNLLIVLRSKHPLYAIHWMMHCLSTRLGGAWPILWLIGVFGSRGFIFFCKEEPSLRPLFLPLAILYVCFMAYIFAGVPLFNLLTRKGIIKL